MVVYEGEKWIEDILGMKSTDDDEYYQLVPPRQETRTRKLNIPRSPQPFLLKQTQKCSYHHCSVVSVCTVLHTEVQNTHLSHYTVRTLTFTVQNGKVVTTVLYCVQQLLHCTVLCKKLKKPGLAPE